MINNLKENYENPMTMISENGSAFRDIADEEGFVTDFTRIRYIKAHLQVVHQAIQQGANLKGYYVWSLIDNFEWAHGYGPLFGIIRVDRGTKRRIPKESALWYRDVISKNAIDI